MKFMKKMAAVVVAATVATISMAGMSSMTTSAADQIASAYFIGGFGNETPNWGDGENSGCTVASIDGDAQYEVVWNLTCEGAATKTDSSWFLAVCITPNTSAGVENFTTDTYPDLKVTLDEVYVNGQKLNYSVSDNAINTAYYEKKPGVTRIYLHDNWSGTNLTDMPDMTIENSIKAVFTISGTGQTGTSNVSDNTTPADNTTPTDGTTTAPDTEKKSDETTTAAAGETTTTAAGGNGGSSNGNSSNGGSSNSGNNSSSGGSSSSNSSKSGTNNAKTSQTGDFGIAAVALGAVATAALGVGAYTITRKKK